MQSPHILIVGGGFAGIETALFLRQRLADQARLTLVAAHPDFVFRPFLTYVPFGLTPERVHVDLIGIAQTHAFTFRQGRVLGVEPERRRVLLDDGPLDYDYLVVATGAAMAASAPAGLYEHAFLIWREDDLVRLRASLDRLVHAARGGQRQRVAFVVPPGCTWGGALYETAFMLESWLGWQEVAARVDLSFYTSEATPLGVLGDGVSQRIEAQMADRGVKVEANSPLRRVERQALVFDDRAAPFDLLIAVPPYAGLRAWEALPTDRDGFVRTRHASRQVVDHPDVYAVGDASDYPVKQAFVALLQADAAAEDLAARVLGAAPTFHFEPSSLWLIEQLDQALLARIPLGADGGGVTPAAPGDDVLEELPVGQLRRMAIRAYLPWQLDTQNPLYAGLFWKGTRVGLSTVGRLHDASLTIRPRPTAARPSFAPRG